MSVGPGQPVAHYTLMEKLGEGGMGVVYKALDTKLDRTVALKFLPSHLSLDDTAKTRFVREAKAASALDHANICTIHDIGETVEGELYIVMAHYEGSTLRQRMESDGFTVEQSLDVATQLASALARAHEAGIVHRDVKPANVLITDRGEAKLLDFGVAKLTSGQELTRTGATLGTVAYMSPEQVEGGQVDGRADLWSLGAVLYELLAGVRPFSRGSEMATMLSVLNDDPPPLDTFCPAAPESILTLVADCLQKDVEKRPRDADEVLERLGRPRPAGTLVAGGTGRGAGPLWKGAAVLGAVSLVFAMGVSLSQRRGADGTGLPESTIAVLPFGFRGSPALEYLGEGIVDLVSAKLNGAGPLITVDPRLVVSLVTNAAADLADPEAGRRIAREVRAGRYVSGDLLETGGRLQITAYLHHTERSDGAFERATAEGSAEEVFELLDGLVAKLVATSLGEGHRLEALATITSSSLDAAKEYLRGEQALRRGLYREASAAYDNAVALDSTFALAYYRKSIAADWIDAYDARTSAERATELAGKLSPRDQRLLEALRLRRNGRIGEAEDAYRALVHQYPQDVEALGQLGELLFHDMPRRGRSIAEAIAPFQQTVDLEPANHIAQLHRARLYALADSLDRLAETTSFLVATAPDSERALEVEALYGYMLRDTVRQESVKSRLVSQPWYFTFHAVHGVGRFARDIHGAADLLSANRTDDPLLLSLVPNHLALRGQHVALGEFLDTRRRENNPTWDLFEAFLLTSGTFPVDSIRMGSAETRLAQADPSALLTTSWVGTYEDITARFAAFQRDYYRALLLIQLGRVDEARGLVDDLRTQDEFTGLGSVKRDADRSLAAEILLQEGDRAGALALLREMEFEMPHAVSYQPMPEQSRARFLRASLEEVAGDEATARRFLLGLDGSWSPWDAYHRPLVYQHLGALEERAGNPEQAAVYYRRLIELWRDCDPELVPARNGIVDRLERLQAD